MMGTGIRTIDGEIVTWNNHTEIVTDPDCCCNEVCNDVVDVEFEFTGVTNTDLEECSDCEWLNTGTFVGTGYTWETGVYPNEKKIQLSCTLACAEWDADRNMAVILQANAGPDMYTCFYGKEIIEGNAAYTYFPITINNGQNATECGGMAAKCGTGGSGTVSEH